MAGKPPPPQEPLPPRIVAVAYLLAAICAVVPLAVVGAIFAGVVVANRGLRGHGTAVIVLAIACAALGVVLLQ
jgi:hypothetical protein